jgi:hypothetical protein
MLMALAVTFNTAFIGGPLAGVDGLLRRGGFVRRLNLAQPDGFAGDPVTLQLIGFVDLGAEAVIVRVLQLYGLIGN